MITLALDASTYDGSVAVLDGSRVVAESQAVMRGRDAERLLPAVEATLKASGIPLANVDRVVCGSGPGSFTSLRIAGSIGKGIALGAGKPLFAVSSLALIVGGNAAEPGRYLALIDAMRGEYFAAVFVFDGSAVVAEGAPILMARSELDVLAGNRRAMQVGPDFGDRWQPRARGVSRLERTLSAGGPVSLADWEPTYGRLAEAQVRLEAASR
ncbi:MAG: tRNA (adenosine(37)-N6)-threonylcarbamoyltransferase complex dimerization subunit type 1 TsaB [Gemmatimonadota bacterium]